MTGRIEKTVFISYRRTNLPWALAIYQELTHNGYDVFFDYLSIPSGDFEKIIIENIKARAHFVVILTPSALERCNEPRDWLRREIETAMNEKRNIVPLMLESFDFGSPSTTNALTGKLENLKKYNGLRVHSEYFFEGMRRLREQYLNVALDTVVHPVSRGTLPISEEHQAAASKAAPVEKKELTAQEWFEKGNAYYVKGETENSIQCFTEAIRLSPNFAYAYNNRGAVYASKGDLRQAIKDYNRTIKIEPNFAEAYYNRGLLRGKNKGDIDGAISDFDKVININPSFAQAYVNRGLAYDIKEMINDALENYNKGIQLDPNLDYAYCNRAVIWAVKKDYIRAIADFEKYLELGGGKRKGDQEEIEKILIDLKNRLAKQK